MQTARDTAAELNAAGAANELVTQGLTNCNFQVSPAPSGHAVADGGGAAHFHAAGRRDQTDAQLAHGVRSVRRRSRQRGMSLVVAIFLVTVVASLAAFAVTVGTANTDGANLQLQADRARRRRAPGPEWGAYRALVANSCVAAGEFQPRTDGVAGVSRDGHAARCGLAWRRRASSTSTRSRRPNTFGNPGYASRAAWSRRVW